MSDKELTAEEKASLIGKDIGANGLDKNTASDAESVPDYDITEENDSVSSKEDSDDDKRLGKSRDDRDGEKRLTNREKRQLRKKRLAQKFDEKDGMIRQLQDQVNQLGSKFAEVDGKLSQVDYQTLVGQYNEANNAFQAAEAAHMEAFKTGDGESATRAMRSMYIAQKRIDECEAIDARNRELAGQPRQVQQPQGHNPVVVAKAQEWGKRNPWFKPGGKDDDSAIADTIAIRMKREGWDDTSDDFWDELDDRLESKGIGSAQDDEDDDQQNQSQSQRERQVREKPSIRRSPPVGGGNGRGDLQGGKVAVSLPTVFINALKESGIWSDPIRRNKAIREHQRIKAEGGR